MVFQSLFIPTFCPFVHTQTQLKVPKMKFLEKKQKKKKQKGLCVCTIVSHAQKNRQTKSTNPTLTHTVHALTSVCFIKPGSLLQKP